MKSLWSLDRNGVWILLSKGDFGLVNIAMALNQLFVAYRGNLCTSGSNSGAFECWDLSTLERGVSWKYKSKMPDEWALDLDGEPGVSNYR